MTASLTLTETVKAYGLMAKKSLGQNFLLDQNITDKIIRMSLIKQGLQDLSGKNILEIGPGPGGLTRAILAQKPAHLTVVELDERCIDIMQNLKDNTPTDMDIVRFDALKFDIASFAHKPVQIVSNLPYHISVPLLIKWIHEIKDIEAMTLMFQTEVAERITAAPQSKAYGRLSVLVQLVCHVDKLLHLNPECFMPAPKVCSTVLLFKPLQDAVSQDVLRQVEYITGLAFSARRKMIRQSLKSIPDLENMAGKIGIALTSRAEEIAPKQYMALAAMMLEKNKS
ncbi:MAG: 16S rRNA (adenine(1518)-N(6)/adenine(1519)-N(6))-dimethyltransferase RsmA [Alphaproteobacteria bacterium]|nr:16S rRNA (adenine(1518)-N(6)/adenine(1519)-N(6))-dimethyltransferase RsmA [Alphaproteobacteria bacterium]